MLFKRESSTPKDGIISAALAEERIKRERGR
jgi:hypothetical protein